jgi:Ras-related protein Rab-8A|eukprot:Stramenopile-MAST_4_protein_4048
MAQQRGGDKQVNIKLLTIGDSAVGKTCLISQFARDSFNPNFITTIGIDYKIKPVEIDGKKYKLLIWDTAGQERFRTITTSYFRGCQGILLVYDITNRKTYDSIKVWMEQIEKINDQNVNKILVGNKCDLEDERQVTFEEGTQMAAEYQIPFLEASAKDNINVADAFMQITRNVIPTLSHTAKPSGIKLDQKSGGSKPGGKKCC